VIGAWPSLRVLELQEDASRPCPIPYLDATSRYGLLQLRVKNFGAAAAYDVRLRWDTPRPRNYKGDEVTSLDEIEVLVPQDSVSAWLGPPRDVRDTNETKRFGGEVDFRDANGRRLRQRFSVRIDSDGRSRLMHDDETLRTLFDLQKIPERLADIEKAINRVQAKIGTEDAAQDEA
jgi:hypothetical protein